MERLHSTIAAAITRFQKFADARAAQRAFDAFQSSHNHVRPHEALDYAVPRTRYTPCDRCFPERLSEIVHGLDDEFRLVRS